MGGAFISPRLTSLGGGSGGPASGGGGEAGRVAVWTSSVAIGGFAPFTYTTNAVSLSSANSGAANTLTVANTSNTASSAASVLISVGGGTAADPFTLFTVTGVTNFYVGLDNSASDAFVIGSGTTPGAADYLTISTGGLITLGATGGASFHAVNGRGFNMTYTTAGSTGFISFVHTSNSANSGLAVDLAVGGASAGDSYYAAGITSSTYWAWGLDNSDSDVWVLSQASTLGTNNFLRVTTAGSVQIGATGGAQAHMIRGTVSVSFPTAGSNAFVEATHTDNTNAASHAILIASVGGTSGGNPLTSYQISGGSSWSVGVKNASSDAFSISQHPTTLGTNEALAIAITTLTATFGGIVNASTAGIRTKVSTADTATPPTDAELDAAFGTPATVGSGFIGVVDDAGAHTAQYLAVSDGTAWFTYAGVLAV